MIRTVTKTLCLTLVVSLLSACASKERFDTAKAINEQCHLEMQAAHTAIRLRDKGKPKTFLLEPLPAITEESSRLLVNLHAIVYETFEFPELNEIIYPTYRFKLCLRALQHKPYPVSLTVIEQPLLDCQHRYGKESSEQSTECVATAIDRLLPGQLVAPDTAKTHE